MPAMTHDTPPERIAANVRAEMARRSVTSRDLREVLGKGREAVGQRLRGIVPFRADELSRVAAYLGIDVSEFYDH